MNKISRFAAVLAVFFLVFGLTGCFFIGGNDPAPASDPTDMDIADAASLKTFFENGSENGKLTADISATDKFEVPVDKTKSLDLNGFDITVSQSGAILVKGNLTITDSSSDDLSEVGKVESTYVEGYAVRVNSGSLTINNGYFKSPRTALQIDEDATAAITKGKFEANTGIGVLEGGTITSMSCDVVATYNAVGNLGTIETISGGTYIADGFEASGAHSYGLWNQGSITTISAGVFSASTELNDYCAFGLCNEAGATIGTNLGSFYAFSGLGTPLNLNLGTITTGSGAHYYVNVALNTPQNQASETPLETTDPR
ncbi:MAG: hypothetical protein J5647_08285 [Spirochaetaceae bacterium]|nr:hypothetical protein [Spirochaetaceae bacterium]